MDVTPLPPRLRRLPARPGPGGLILHEAHTPWSRLAGLIGLPGLPPGHGLWLPRTRSVHTFGMRFRLDLVWVDAHGRVVRIDERVAEGSVRTCHSARSVIELASPGSGALSFSLPGAEQRLTRTRLRSRLPSPEPRST